MATGIAAGDLAALGENSRMLVGGDSGSVTNGVWIRFVTGNVAASAAPVDATDNMSEGFTEPSRGPRTLTITADCIWRADDNPIEFAPNFEEGELTERLVVWPDYENAPGQYFKCPTGFCDGITVTIQGTADCRFNVQLKNFGRYYTPSRVDPTGVL